MKRSTHSQISDSEILRTVVLFKFEHVGGLEDPEEDNIFKFALSLCREMGRRCVGAAWTDGDQILLGFFGFDPSLERPTDEQIVRVFRSLVGGPHPRGLDVQRRDH